MLLFSAQNIYVIKCQGPICTGPIPVRVITIICKIMQSVMDYDRATCRMQETRAVAHVRSAPIRVTWSAHCLNVAATVAYLTWLTSTVNW